MMYQRYKILNIKNFIITLTYHILAYVKIVNNFKLDVLCFV
jgi:hypothetical protein